MPTNNADYHHAERVPQEYLEQRLTAVKSKVAELGLDALVVQSGVHKGYLSGFTSGPFIAPGGVILVTGPGRENVYVTGGTDYEECRTALEPAGFVVHPYFYSRGTNVHTELRAVAERLGLKRLGAEAKYATYRWLADTQAAVRDTGASVEPLTTEIVDPLREVKDPWEVAQIRAAVETSGYAFADILEVISAGICEWQLAVKLEGRLVAGGLGSPRVAFQSIVASGPRSALPHGGATRRRLQDGDFVTLDFGATHNGYCADVTRTVVVGTASARHQEIYQAVVEAKDAAIALMVPGRPRKDSAAAAAEVIRKYGLEEYLAHGTGGHGIGLEVHEGPSTSSEGVWVVGNVCTLEPGVYIPGWGGVRVEDDVLITEDGNEVLTRRIAQELLEIG